MGPAAVQGRLWGTAAHDGPGCSSRLCGRLARLKPEFGPSGLVSGGQNIGPAR
jgi:hypothetical protein